MELKRLISIFVFILGLSAFSNVSAEYLSGNITRTLTSSSQYGGCMIHLDVANICAGDGWVSLDCDGTVIDAEKGKRNFMSAILAFSLDKRVTIRIAETWKVNNYCIVNRIDVHR